MINKTTNINNYLSPKIIEHENSPRHMALEMHILYLDMHQKCFVVKPVPLPLYCRWYTFVTLLYEKCKRARHDIFIDQTNIIRYTFDY